MSSSNEALPPKVPPQPTVEAKQPVNNNPNVEGNHQSSVEEKRKGSSNPLEWFASAGKKLIANITGSSKQKPDGDTKPRRKRFWKKSPASLPGAVKQSSTPTPAGTLHSHQDVVATRQYPLHARSSSGPPQKRSGNINHHDVSHSPTHESNASGTPSPSNATNGSLTGIVQADGDGTPEEEEKNEEAENALIQKERARLNRYLQILEEDTCDITALQKLAWSGVAPEVRNIVWQILLGYLPANRMRRQAVLLQRRKEYSGYVKTHYEADRHTDEEAAILRQICVDVPRTCSGLPMFQNPVVQKCLERILFVWAIRHPASGYVQGINDIVIPFFIVFLSAVTGIGHDSLEALRSIDNSFIERVSTEQFEIVEADAYWCLSKLLDGIQDHYTFAQPGIQKMVFKLKELTSRIDADLHNHLDLQGVQFIQFAFRWMNCLLLRELSLPLIIRCWDAYLSDADGTGFKIFHVYVCAALLKRFAVELKGLEFQDLVVHLQNLPTSSWDNKDVETLLAEAYVYMTLFDNSPNHLQ